MTVRNFYEKRACEKCGYTRNVKVLAFTKPGEATETESWNRLCAICKLVERAEIHQRAARNFEERAVRMRLARNGREVKKRGAA